MTGFTPRPDEGEPVDSLVPAWQRQAKFTVLHVLQPGRNFGPVFHAALTAWRSDPLRCTRLDFVAVLPQPATPGLLGDELAARCPLLLPGLHRIEFGVDKNTHGGPARAVLTLAVGDAAALLPQLRLAADVLWADFTGPPLAKALARLARPGAMLAARSPPELAEGCRKSLTEAGFLLDPVQGDATRIAGTYAPAWPRPAGWPDNRRAAPVRRAIVIGAGIAGACITWSLARRGWEVSLLDAADGPAAGASGLPAGLMVPHVSPDDAPMSRLTRQGAALMREWIEAVGLARTHWQEGVLQLVDDRHKARAPAAWNGRGLFEWRDTPEGRPARFFPKGLALEPAALVRSLLADSAGLTTHWGSRVTSLARSEADTPPCVWSALDADGRMLAQAPVVVVASAIDSLRIAGDGQDTNDAQGRAILRPVRGQITLGRSPMDSSARAFLPGQPLSGDGHFIPALHADALWAWLVGASFDRGETALQASPAAEAGNLEKLARLAPAFAEQVARSASAGDGHDAWVGVRCTSPDRLPLVGALPGANGVHLLAAMGSRGLSLAAVCAELLACQLADEPWPVEASLAQALDPARFTPR